MTDDEKHDFVADVTGHLLAEIDKGVTVFAVLSFRHDADRDSMHCSHATIKVGMSEEDERMSDRVAEIVADFMDAHAPRWAQ